MDTELQIELSNKKKEKSNTDRSRKGNENLEIKDRKRYKTTNI